MSFAPFAALQALAQAATSARSDWAGLTYTQFCARIGVKLTRAQLALSLVAFDGLEPRELRGDLRDLARGIFGDVDIVPARARRVLAAVCGARGGKTYTLGALRILHLALTVSLKTMAPGERAVGLIVAPRRELAEQCLRYVAGAIGESEGLTAIATIRTERIVISRPDGDVSIETAAASSGGVSLRGRSLVGAILDECAFFHDADYQVNDVELFRAAAARVLPGGQTILCSTPWAEAGLLFDEFVANHPSPQCAAPNHAGTGHPHRALAAHAPSLVLRDGAPELASVVESETERDPINARREYGAVFLTAGTGLYFDAGAVGRCGRAELVLPAAVTTDPHVLSIGADLGFTTDSAACAAVERTAKGARLLDLLELRPLEGPLKPSVVFAEFAGLAVGRGVEHIVSDGHYKLSAAEAFWADRIALIDAPAGQLGKGEMFTTLRRYIHEGRLELPAGPMGQRLMTQLREVASKPTPGGGMSIIQPRKGKGGHGDLVSALAAALWHADRLTLPAAPEVLPDDPREAQAVEWERRIAAREQEREARRSVFGGVRYDVRRDGWR